MKKATALMGVFALLTAFPSSSPAQSTTNNKVVMTVGDIVVMRPLMFAATVTGFATFVVSYPILAFTDDGTAWDNMVVKPARATFTRCIGCDIVEKEGEEQ